MTEPWWPKPLFALAVVLAVCAYWIGLSGPFLLDDPENFTQLQRYVDGQVDWIGPIVSNGSGPLGRGLSMASFLLTAHASGMSPWAFKAANLMIHVSVASLAGILAILILRRDPRTLRFAAPAGAFVAAAWILLPIHASTVLYAVQRMAQLSTLFMLLGLLAYIVVRTRIETGRIRPAAGGAALALAVATFTILAALAKENGLLLPLLCAVVEVTCFSRAAHADRIARAALVVFVLAPATLVATVLVLAPDTLFGGYALRNFTLEERLLTQPRVLWDYVAGIVMPFGPRMGLFQDDFPISRTLWSPWTTLPALLAWVAVAIGAWFARKSFPALAAGVLLFLAAHAMESTILPLEIYFEHRNYLPSVGLLVAIAAAASVGLDALGPTTRIFSLARGVLGMAFVGVLAYAVHGRATVWAAPELLITQSALNRPDSPRVQAMLAAEAMALGDLARAIGHFERLAQLSPHEAATAKIWKINARCRAGASVTRAELLAIEALLPGAPSPFALRAGMTLAENLEANACPGLSLADGAAFFDAWRTRLTVKSTSHAAWRFTLISARLRASAGRWAEALDLAEAAWRDSNWNTGIGVIVVQIANSKGDAARSSAAVERLAETAPPWDREIQRAIVRFRQSLAAPPAS